MASNSNIENSSRYDTIDSANEDNLSKQQEVEKDSNSDNIKNILNKFEDFENAMKTGLPKVDPRLVRDYLHRRRNDPMPMYTIEIFMNGKPDTDELKQIIFRHLGVMPAFYDNGTHVVVAHRFNLQMLDTVSHYPNVERIRGTFTGAGRGASIGPVFEREDREDYYYTSNTTIK